MLVLFLDDLGSLPSSGLIWDKLRLRSLSSLQWGDCSQRPTAGQVGLCKWEKGGGGVGFQIQGEGAKVVGIRQGWRGSCLRVGQFYRPGVTSNFMKGREVDMNIY